MKRLISFLLVIVLLTVTVLASAQQLPLEGCPLFAAQDHSWEVKKTIPEGVLENFLYAGCQLEQMITSQATAQEIFEYQRIYVLSYKTLLTYVPKHLARQQDLTDPETIQLWLDALHQSSETSHIDELEIGYSEQEVCFEDNTCEYPLAVSSSQLVGILTQEHDFWIFYSDFAVYRYCDQSVTQSNVMEAFDCPIFAIMLLRENGQGIEYRIFNSLGLALTNWEPYE